MSHTAFATSSIFATNLSTLKPTMKASAKNPISLAPAFAVDSSTNKPAFKEERQGYDMEQLTATLCVLILGVRIWRSANTYLSKSDSGSFLTQRDIASDRTACNLFSPPRWAEKSTSPKWRM